MGPVRYKYPQESMLQALLACKNGMSIKKASETFNVPRMTLSDKLRGKTQEWRKIGRDTYLTHAEEQHLVEWITLNMRRGTPVKKSDLYSSVQTIIGENNRATPFTNNRPGHSWYKRFLKRHPEVALRTPQRLSRNKAKIQEEDIRKWFNNLQRELEEKNCSDIFDDPKRIFNADETNIQLSPETGKVLAIKGWKNVYEISPGSEKSTLTFLGTFNANGDIATPMLIFPYLRIPKEIAASVKDDWFVGASESGWMRSGNFFEYVVNGFYEWLVKKNIQRPVILFVDGHKAHLTAQLNHFCEGNGIILYQFPPHATHILQPADVGVFKPLKLKWKSIVHEWQKDHPYESLLKKDVGGLLANVLNRISPSTIINSFRTCGLYPLNPNFPDFSKCLNYNDSSDNDNRILTNDNQHTNPYRHTLAVVQDLIDKNQNITNLQTLLGKLKELSNVDSDKTNFDIKIQPTTDTNLLLPSPCIQPEINASHSINFDINRPWTSGEARLPVNDAFRNHTFWPGEVSYKKYKLPKEMLPGSTAAADYRTYYKNIETNRKKTKSQGKGKKRSRNDDWICIYCDCSWNDQDERGIICTWIECSAKMHLECIPSMPILEEFNDEEDFICDKCIYKANSQLSC